MGFKDKYTTKEKKDADTSPEKIENSKVEVSPDVFALGDSIEMQTITLQNLIRSLIR